MKGMKFSTKDLRRHINKPNFAIGLISVLLGTMLILFASLTNDILHDLFISLSASIYSVGFTVLAVDGLRAIHKKEANTPARKNALQRISGANTVLALTLAVHARHNHEEILKGFLNSRDNSDAHDNAMIMLSEVDAGELLIHFPDNKLITDLSEILGKVSESLNEQYGRYSYLFEDDLKSQLLGMIESSDAASKMVRLILNMDNGDIEKIFTTVGEKSPSLPLAKSAMSPFVSKYLQDYAKFVKAYIRK